MNNSVLLPVYFDREASAYSYYFVQLWKYFTATVTGSEQVISRSFFFYFFNFYLSHSLKILLVLISVCNGKNITFSINFQGKYWERNWALIKFTFGLFDRKITHYFFTFECVRTNGHWYFSPLVSDQIAIDEIYLWNS